MEHLLAAFLGVVAGTLSAMFGVGGGLIFVPTLIFLGSNTHQAVATSLAAMIPAILVGSGARRATAPCAGRRRR